MSQIDIDLKDTLKVSFYNVEYFHYSMDSDNIGMVIIIKEGKHTLSGINLRNINQYHIDKNGDNWEITINVPIGNNINIVKRNDKTIINDTLS
jgi:hypothetical protein